MPSLHDLISNHLAAEQQVDQNELINTYVDELNRAWANLHEHADNYHDDEALCKLLSQPSEIASSLVIMYAVNPGEAALVLKLFFTLLDKFLPGCLETQENIVTATMGKTLNFEAGRAIIQGLTHLSVENLNILSKTQRDKINHYQNWLNFPFNLKAVPTYKDHDEQNSYHDIEASIKVIENSTALYTERMRDTPQEVKTKAKTIKDHITVIESLFPLPFDMVTADKLNIYKTKILEQRSNTMRYLHKLSTTETDVSKALIKSSEMAALLYKTIPISYLTRDHMSVSDLDLMLTTLFKHGAPENLKLTLTYPAKLQGQNASAILIGFLIEDIKQAAHIPTLEAVFKILHYIKQLCKADKGTSDKLVIHRTPVMQAYINRCANEKNECAGDEQQQTALYEHLKGFLWAGDDENDHRYVIQSEKTIRAKKADGTFGSEKHDVLHKQYHTLTRLILSLRHWPLEIEHQALHEYRANHIAKAEAMRDKAINRGSNSPEDAYEDQLKAVTPDIKEPIDLEAINQNLDALLTYVKQKIYLGENIRSIRIQYTPEGADGVTETQNTMKELCKAITRNISNFQITKGQSGSLCGFKQTFQTLEKIEQLGMFVHQKKIDCTQEKLAILSEYEIVIDAMFKLKNDIDRPDQAEASAFFHGMQREMNSYLENYRHPFQKTCPKKLSNKISRLDKKISTEVYSEERTLMVQQNYEYGKAVDKIESDFKAFIKAGADQCEKLSVLKESVIAFNALHAAQGLKMSGPLYNSSLQILALQAGMDFHAEHSNFVLKRFIQNVLMYRLVTDNPTETNSPYNFIELITNTALASYFTPNTFLKSLREHAAYINNPTYKANPAHLRNIAHALKYLTKADTHLTIFNDNDNKRLLEGIIEADKTKTILDEVTSANALLHKRTTLNKYKEQNTEHAIRRFNDAAKAYANGEECDIPALAQTDIIGTQMVLWSHLDAPSLLSMDKADQSAESKHPGVKIKHHINGIIEIILNLIDKESSTKKKEKYAEFTVNVAEELAFKMDEHKLPKHYQLAVMLLNTIITNPTVKNALKECKLSKKTNNTIERLKTLLEPAPDTTTATHAYREQDLNNICIPNLATLSKELVWSGEMSGVFNRALIQSKQIKKLLDCHHMINMAKRTFEAHVEHEEAVARAATVTQAESTIASPFYHLSRPGPGELEPIAEEDLSESVLEHSSDTILNLNTSYISSTSSDVTDSDRITKDNDFHRTRSASVSTTDNTIYSGSVLIESDYTATESALLPLDREDITNRLHVLFNDHIKDKTYTTRTSCWPWGKKESHELTYEQFLHGILTYFDKRQHFPDKLANWPASTYGTIRDLHRHEQANRLGAQFYQQQLRGKYSASLEDDLITFDSPDHPGKSLFPICRDKRKNYERKLENGAMLEYQSPDLKQTESGPKQQLKLLKLKGVTSTNRDASSLACIAEAIVGLHMLDKHHKLYIHTQNPDNAVSTAVQIKVLEHMVRKLQREGTKPITIEPVFLTQKMRDHVYQNSKKISKQAKKTINTLDKQAVSSDKAIIKAMKQWAKAQPKTKQQSLSIKNK